MTALAARWVDKGWSVTILTFAGPTDAAFFRADPRVTEVRLDLFAVSRTPFSGVVRNLGRLRRLRQAIRATKPDAVLSFMDRTNVLTLLATVGQPWPVVVSDRTDPNVSPGRGWSQLRSLAYLRAHRIVVQTTAARLALPARRRARTAVIPNPVLQPAEVPVSERAIPAEHGSSGNPATSTDGGREMPAGATTSAGRVVALGRLVEAKGFDLLLRAFAIVHRRRPGATLEIWGEGTEHASLLRLRDELGLATAIDLRGETRTPVVALRRGDVFVLSSRHEGFPNVLLEAMAEGIAAVAFDCPYGPAEIIRDGVDGILVRSGDVEGLASAIDRMLDDPLARSRLGARAVEVRQRFDLERIGQMWDELLIPWATGADGAR